MGEAIQISKFKSLTSIINSKKICLELCRPRLAKWHRRSHIFKLNNFFSPTLYTLVTLFYPFICFGYTVGDIDHDNQIGLQETIYSLQVVSGVQIPLTGKTINVPSGIPTIQEAIDAAVDGDTINIAAGTFSENLNIKDKSLVLSGQGIGSTIIDGNGSNVITVENGHGVALEKFTVQHGGRGIFITNNSSSKLDHIAVKDCTNRGIQIWSNSSAEISDSTVENSGSDGIAVMGTSIISITGTVTTHNNSRHGMMIFLGSTALSQGANFSSLENLQRGISVNNNSAFFISGSGLTVRDNNQNGIHVSETSSVSILNDSTLTVEITDENHSGTEDNGIAIYNTSTLWSAGTINIAGMSRNGMITAGGSNISLDGNTFIQNCHDQGFYVTRGSSAYLSARLEATNCDLYGIVISRDSMLQSENSAHIVVKSTNAVTVDEYNYTGGIGISVFENSLFRANSGTIEITDNDAEGIEVGSNSTMTLRKRVVALNAVISGNGGGPEGLVGERGGVYVYQNSNIELDPGVYISSNNDYGIKLYDSVSATIRSNNINNNGFWGILTDNGSSLILTDSTLQSNGTGNQNISLSFGSRSELNGNTISGSTLSCDPSVLSRGDLVCP